MSDIIDSGEIFNNIGDIDWELSYDLTEQENREYNIDKLKEGVMKLSYNHGVPRLLLGSNESFLNNIKMPPYKYYKKSYLTKERHCITCGRKIKHVYWVFFEHETLSTPILLELGQNHYESIFGKRKQSEPSMKSNSVTYFKDLLVKMKIVNVDNILQKSLKEFINIVLDGFVEHDMYASKLDDLKFIIKVLKSANNSLDDKIARIISNIEDVIKKREEEEKKREEEEKKREEERKKREEEERKKQEEEENARKIIARYAKKNITKIKDKITKNLEKKRVEKLVRKWQEITKRLEKREKNKCLANCKEDAEKIKKNKKSRVKTAPILLVGKNLVDDKPKTKKKTKKKTNEKDPKPILNKDKSLSDGDLLVLSKFEEWYADNKLETELEKWSIEKLKHTKNRNFRAIIEFNKRIKNIIKKEKYITKIIEEIIKKKIN